MDVACGRSPSHGTGSGSFPAKLHYMLADVEERCDGLELCVCWAPHGRCFLVKDKKTFMEKVMPKYFYQLKFNSFQRQLNLHGFKKLQGQGPDKGGYYHEWFLRSRPDLAERIRRCKPKADTSKSRCLEIGREPNFYSMCPLPLKSQFPLSSVDQEYDESSKSSGVLILNQFETGSRPFPLNCAERAKPTHACGSITRGAAADAVLPTSLLSPSNADESDPLTAMILANTGQVAKLPSCCTTKASSTQGRTTTYLSDGSYGEAIECSNAATNMNVADSNDTGHCDHWSWLGTSKMNSWSNFSARSSSPVVGGSQEVFMREPLPHRELPVVCELDLEPTPIGCSAWVAGSNVLGRAQKLSQITNDTPSGPLRSQFTSSQLAQSKQPAPKTYSQFSLNSQENTTVSQNDRESNPLGRDPSPLNQRTGASYDGVLYDSTGMTTSDLSHSNTNSDSLSKLLAWMEESPEMEMEKQVKWNGARHEWPNMSFMKHGRG